MQQFLQFIILTFIYSSTCFGRPYVHHQELNNCSGSLWFYLRSVVIAVLLVVVGPAEVVASGWRFIWIGEKLLGQARNHKDTASIINHVFFTFTVALLLAFSRRGMVIYKQGIRQQRDKQVDNIMKTSKTRDRRRKWHQYLSNEKRKESQNIWIMYRHAFCVLFTENGHFWC